MKISLILVLLNILLRTQILAQNPPTLDSNPKKLTPDEIIYINKILENIEDTISIKVKPEYKKELYSSYPENFKNELQKRVIESGFSLRPDSSFYRGIKEAKENLRAGKLIRKSYGLNRIFKIESTTTTIFSVKNVDYGSWQADVILKYILLNRYAIETDDMAGCIVNESLVAYREGYDLIFVPVVNALYGFDVFERANKEITEIIMAEGMNHKEWQSREEIKYKDNRSAD